jgi:hypothetical protein
MSFDVGAYLTPEFFKRSAEKVAPDLLGVALARRRGKFRATQSPKLRPMSGLTTWPVMPREDGQRGPSPCSDRLALFTFIESTACCRHRGDRLPSGRLDPKY